MPAFRLYYFATVIPRSVQLCNIFQKIRFAGFGDFIREMRLTLPTDQLLFAAWLKILPGIALKVD